MPSIFTFVSYDFNPSNGEVSLTYRLDETSFTEKLIFPIKDVAWKQVDTEALNRALFALHLVGGMSYWKTTCTPTMRVESGQLTQAMADYWTQQYRRGLSEFFFRNKIDWTSLALFSATNAPISHFSAHSSLRAEAKQSQHNRDCFVGAPTPPRNDVSLPSFLLPIGGGKDSTVTALALRKAGYDFTTFAVQDAPPILATVHTLDTPHVSVQRFIDPELIARNKQPGIYNGHVPISLYWSFVSLVTAILHRKTDIVFSWEASASEGNTTHLGQVVNHQYSKSLECERALQSFIATSITPSVRVWSLIRPLTEFAIMGLFAQAPEFFPVFSSCNRNFTAKSLASGAATFWCGTCAKCAFVFPLFAAWTSHQQACEVFGKDLFADETLLPLFAQLCGIDGMKPFECVGEAEETAVAFAMIADRGQAGDSPAMRWYQEHLAPAMQPVWREKAKALCTPRTEHAIPEDIQHIVSIITHHCERERSNLCHA